MSNTITIAGCKWPIANGCASLEGADLEGAYLRCAYLRGANLKGAYLRGANGVYELDMADPRGYRPLAVAHIDGWRISSGCRWFTCIC